MKCTWRLSAKRLWPLTISSSPVTKPNFQRPANAWRKIKKSCLPSMTFRPNIGPIYGPPIPSNPPSPPSGFEPIEPRVAAHESTTLTMVFKLGLEAQKHWRRLNGPELVAKVVTGLKFVDGEEATQQAAKLLKITGMRGLP